MGFLSEPSSPLNPHKVSKVVSDTYATPIPYPRRFQHSKKEEHEKAILDTFRKVQVNIPLLDAIKQVPKYAKFLKELCTNKRKFGKYETVALSEEVSAVLQRKLPPKLKDPGSFTIPCTIGTTRFERALLDLGASINLMPYSVYAALNLGPLKETNVTIQLADRSLKYPKGMIEDVLVSVDGLILPADFFVLDMEEAPVSTSLPLILGRPFMRTARTKIDVFDGTLTMTVLGETVGFNIFEALRYPTTDSCFSTDVIDEIVQDTFNATVGKDPLETALVHNVEQKAPSTDENTIETVAALTVAPQHGNHSRKDHKPKKSHSSTTSPSTHFTNDSSSKKTSRGDPTFPYGPPSFQNKTMRVLTKLGYGGSITFG